MGQRLHTLETSGQECPQQRAVSTATPDDKAARKKLGRHAVLCSKPPPRTSSRTGGEGGRDTKGRIHKRSDVVLQRSKVRAAH